MNEMIIVKIEWVMDNMSDLGGKWEYWNRWTYRCALDRRQTVLTHLTWWKNLKEILEKWVKIVQSEEGGGEKGKANAKFAVDWIADEEANASDDEVKIHQWDQFQDASFIQIRKGDDLGEEGE